METLPQAFVPALRSQRVAVSDVASRRVTHSTPSARSAPRGPRGHHLSAACLAAIPAAAKIAGARHPARCRHLRRVARRATASPDSVPTERERYTDAAWQAMQDAPSFAEKCQSQYVEPEHVFLAALEQPVSTTGGLAARILEKLGIQKQVAVSRVTEPCHPSQVFV